MKKKWLEEIRMTNILNMTGVSIKPYEFNSCPRGEIGRHKGLELKNLSASEETLRVELRKFGGGLTANTEPSQKNFWKV